MSGSHCDVALILLHSPETFLPKGTADWLNRREPYLNAHYHIKMTYSGKSIAVC